MVELFEQTGIGGFPSLQHAKLLWALEALAWNRAFLPRVSLILAGLDEEIPAAKSGNGVARSLREIFMPWLPQTTAPVDERIEGAAETRPEPASCGLAAFLDLVPSKEQISMPIYRPLWRDLGSRLVGPSIPAIDIWELYCAGALERIIEHMGNDVGKWKALIQQLEHLPGPVQREFLERLSGLADLDLDGQTRRTISDSVPGEAVPAPEICRHKLGPSGGGMNELEKVRERFESEDVVTRNASLF